MNRTISTAYCAGLIDGEGCIRVKRCQPYKHLTGRVNYAYNVTIHVRMVESGASYPEKAQPKRRPLFCWQATDAMAEAVIASVLPYLRVKRQQAENALALRLLQRETKKHRTKITGYRNFPNRYGTVRMVPNLAYTDEYIAACESLYQRSKTLNQVGLEAA